MAFGSHEITWFGPVKETTSRTQNSVSANFEVENSVWSANYAINIYMALGRKVALHSGLQLTDTVPEESFLLTNVLPLHP